VLTRMLGLPQQWPAKGPERLSSCLYSFNLSAQLHPTSRSLFDSGVPLAATHGNVTVKQALQRSALLSCEASGCSSRTRFRGKDFANGRSLARDL
jgi:hypothetical protein